MTILMFGFFGIKAFYIVFGAMAIALVTGLIFMLLDSLGWIEGPSEAADPKDISWDRLKNFELKKAAKGTEHFFMQWLGPDFTGMLVTLLFATIIEVCSEGTSPVAFEIFAKTGALGNPFIFLMAGVATDYTEIGLLWSNIGKRTALWLPAVTVPQILVLAWFFNQL
jgi:uncharacterized membrane protein YraQ (UPF0718 family)